MGADSDPIVVTRKSDTFTSVVMDMLANMQVKLLGMMFIIFIIINSDVFINRGLAKFSGAVDMKCPTSWGTILQGLFLVLLCIIVDAAIRQKII